MTREHIRPRMHRRIPVRVELFYEGAASGAGRLFEMSEGGLSFAAEAALPSGESVRLTLDDGTARLAVTGTVVHAGTREGEMVHGVKFDNLDAQTMDAVRAMLKRHRFSKFRPPALPAGR